MPFNPHALLKLITEPMLNMSLEAMAVNAQIIEQDAQLKLQLTAGFPTLPIKKNVQSLVCTAFSNRYPESTIDPHLDFFIKAHRTQLPGMSLRGVKNTIAVASGKGGVGKSTVAVNLAIALARAGARVGILDADIYGPSIPAMLGAHLPIKLQNDRYLPVAVHGIHAMSIGYLAPANQALIWRGPMLAKSLLQMLDITQWEELDYLLIDLPPGTGDIQLSLVQKIPLTGALIVTTPQQIATLDARKAISMFKTTGIEVLGIVENMATYHCQNCGNQETLFGAGGAIELSSEFDIPLLGQLPLDREIGYQCEAGIPLSTQPNHPISTIFMKTALLMAIAIAKLPINYAGKFPPIVVE